MVCLTRGIVVKNRGIRGFLKMQKMEKETWILITDIYSGYYEISSFGQVRSTVSEKIRKCTADSKGYLRVCLYINPTKMKTFKVHRLVAAYFIPNPENKPEVNHIDGNKKNNKVSNLEWATTRENILHAIKNGFRPTTQKQRESAANVLRGNKYSCKKIINTNTGEVFESVKDAAKTVCLSRSGLSGMLTGFRKNKTSLKYFQE